MIKDEKLDFWISNNLNVLFTGKAGVGKTAIITSAFDRHKLKWRYFSAATMDPWVDFIGIPKECQTQDGTKYIDLIRPLEFQRDEVEALFFDEFNRSSKKIRNAVMELIQFKSINGKKFNNLRIIWAAINPSEGDEYDVEKLDPAQQDRFEIQQNIPYKCHRPYFVEKYGSENARAAISWWDELPDEIKNKVSPRRLDNALRIFTQKGDMRDVLPQESNVQKLYTVLKTGPIYDNLKAFYKDSDIESAKKFLSTENSFSASEEYIVKTPEWLEFYLPLFPKEKLSSSMSKYDAVLQHVLNNVNKQIVYKNIVEDIVSANTNKKLCNTIRKVAKTNKDVSSLVNKPENFIIDGAIGSKPEKIHFSVQSNPNFTNDLSNAIIRVKSTTQSYTRGKEYNLIVSKIPYRMTTLESEKLFEFLNIIVNHTHNRGISKFPNFMGIFNNAIVSISLNDGIKWDDICRKYTPQYSSLFGLIVQFSEYAEKVITP